MRTSSLPVSSAPATSGGRSRRGSAGWRIGGLLVLLTGVVLGLGAWSNWDLSALVERLQALPPWALVAAFVVLPILGVSIGLFYLAVGAVFPPWMAGLVIAGGTAVHLLVTHVVVRRFLRERARRWIERRGHDVPEVPPGEDASVALALAVVPGLPYLVRNGVLALSDLPLRIYLPICLVVYVARSYLGVLLGNLSHGFTWERMGWLAAVLVVKVSICAWVVYRLRVRTPRGRGAETP